MDVGLQGAERDMVRFHLAVGWPLLVVEVRTDWPWGASRQGWSSGLADPKTMGTSVAQCPTSSPIPSRPSIDRRTMSQRVHETSTGVVIVVHILLDMSLHIVTSCVILEHMFGEG